VWCHTSTYPLYLYTRATISTLFDVTCYVTHALFSPALTRGARQWRKRGAEKKGAERAPREKKGAEHAPRDKIVSRTRAGARPLGDDGGGWCTRLNLFPYKPSREAVESYFLPWFLQRLISWLLSLFLSLVSFQLTYKNETLELPPISHKNSLCKMKPCSMVRTPPPPPPPLRFSFPPLQILSNALNIFC